MTYDPIFILTSLKLKDQNYSLNNIVKELKLIKTNEKKLIKNQFIGLLIKLYNKNLLNIKLKVISYNEKICRF